MLTPPSLPPTPPRSLAPSSPSLNSPPAHADDDAAAAQCYREYMQSIGQALPPPKGQAQAKGQQSKLLKEAKFGGASGCDDAFFTLQVRIGDLTKETVDVIVNAANQNLDHTGGLAEAIVRAGGQGRKIQKDSDIWVARHGQCQYGNLMYTAGTELCVCVCVFLRCCVKT